MEIFLNDCSFHEQYFERAKLEAGFRIFAGTLNVLQGISVDYILFREPHLPYRVLRAEALTASISKLTDQTLTRLLFEILNRLNVANWRESPIHLADDSFVCANLQVRDTSLAELAERKLRSRELVAALINFPNSRYQSKLQLEVIKNEVDTSQLSCVEDGFQLAAWLKETLNLGFSTYDYDSDEPPQDQETVLRDVTRFRSAGLFQQGRRVHLEVDTRRYWYVDNLHSGCAAHLEVFDSRGLHVGESNLDGDVDTSKRDAKKTIDL
jgi:hypothetical protein